MSSNFETAKISDLGNSKNLESLANSMIGSIGWMAPEVLDTSSYERYADIWSLGCTVYEMFCKKSPF